jgi:transketolase
VITDADRLDAMAITNRTYKLMRDWVDGPLGAEYSMAADWDNRWRTGGTVDEVMDEAHLTSAHIIAGIERFANDRESRLERLRHDVSAAERRD